MKFGPPQLIGLPYDASSSHLLGAAEAPALIRAELNSPAGNSWTESFRDLAASDGLIDSGDLAISTNAASRGEIESAIAELISHQRRPISLGGDHSVTYPILRALRQRHQNITILHIDAHPDLYESFDGDRYSHACPFARIMEEKLAARLVQVGIRTMTAHQRAQADRFGVEMIQMSDWENGVRPQVDGEVYISIDLDGIDPAFAPGVSHREPGGLTVREVIGMIHRVQGQVIGGDVVEYNPRQDIGGMTASVAAKLVKELAGRMLLDI